MDRVELDDALHALTQTMLYYGKELDDNQMRFWRSYLLNENVVEVKAALLAHSHQSRYAPKISDVSDLIKQARQAGAPQYKALAPTPESNCPPEISNAWLYWIKRWHDFDLPGTPDQSAVSESQAEAWLVLVNQEAKRHNTPEAIPEDFKISDIWHRPARAAAI